MRTLVGVKLKYPLYQNSNGEKKMKTQVEKIGNPQGGVVGAGEGAFSPTPNAPAQIKRIDIDLSSLYDLDPLRPAARILASILRNYDAKLLALVNISPETGIEVKYAQSRKLASKIKKTFEEEEDDLVAAEKVAKELAKRSRLEIVIVTLHDGYETAIAFTETLTLSTYNRMVKEEVRENEQGR